MGLSTHVLDTMHGTPAEGMSVALYTLADSPGAANADDMADTPQATLVKRFVLNRDGRNPDGLLYERGTLLAGTYRLVFGVSSYFAAKGVSLPQPNFLNRVTLDFGVADPSQHYHVPLLVSPWSYATYRGS